MDDKETFDEKNSIAEDIEVSEAPGKDKIEAETDKVIMDEKMAEEKNIQEQTDEKIETKEETETEIKIETIETEEPIEKEPKEKTEEVEKPKVEIEKDPNARWYVIHTYSGYENKVKTNLAKRISTMDMQHKIFTVLVPTEEEIEFRDGKRRTVQKKIYPGYVYVEMVMTDESWNVVRNTPGVTGFVGPQGPGFKPIPLDKEEVKHIRRLLGVEAPLKVKLSVDKGHGVRIKSGPFRDFTGLIEEIYPDREKVRVHVFIFGRETPVELDFGQIEKL